MMHSRRHVYYSVAAQQDNLGDVVIRREMARWVQGPHRRPHVYVGSMSDEYIEAVELPSDALLFRDASAYTRRWLRDCTARRCDLVLAPGPRSTVPTVHATGAAARLATMVALTRAAGGAALSIGGSLGGRSQPALSLHQLTGRLLNHLSVRDRLTMDVLPHRARLIPDMAFTDAHPADVPSINPSLVISVRDRQSSWDMERVVKVAELARQHLFRVIVVSQVRRDSELATRLASRLSADLLDWEPGVSHSEQLRRIATTYVDAAVVLTNRLHGAILCAREGALVVDTSTDPASKLAMTLSHVYADFCNSAQQSMNDARFNALLSERTRRNTETRAAAAALEIERTLVRSLLDHGGLERRGDND